MKLSTTQIVVIALVALLVASFAFAWSGSWAFVEGCDDDGLIDVEATYTPSDQHGGTVEYTSPYINLSAGAVVTVRLQEDHGQTATYTVTNDIECVPPSEIPPTPEPTPPPPTPEPPPAPTPPPPPTGCGGGACGPPPCGPDNCGQNPPPTPTPTPTPTPPPVGIPNPPIGGVNTGMGGMSNP